MDALSQQTAAAFRQRAALTARYGRDWWEHDPAVQDLCRRVPGLRLRLYQLRQERGEITTGDVYALVDSPRWPVGWRPQRHPAQRAVLAEQPRRRDLLDAPPDRSLAYITLGLPGSGKTSALRPLAWAHYRSALRPKDRPRDRDGVPAGAAVLDADEVRVLISEYERGLGSSVVQPETAALTYGPVWESLLAGGYSGLLVDTVGDVELLPTTVNALATAGYLVHLLLADVDPKIAEQRVIRRCLSDGRYVSLSYLRGRVGVPQRALRQVLDSDAEIGGWGIWDTTGPLHHLEGGGAFAPDPGA